MSVERVLRGAPASPGLGAGRARVLEPASRPGPPPPDEREGEAQRAEEALGAAAAELDATAARLRDEGRTEEAEIVATGSLMAADPVLASAVRDAVLEGRAGAESALVEAAEHHAEQIAALPDANLAARAGDVRSLGRHAARIASGDGDAPGDDPAVLVARDLGPADVAELGAEVRGIALAEGGVTAHAAIVARSLAVPMAVGLGDDALDATGDVVVSGDAGTITLDPSPALLEEARAAARDRDAARARAAADRNLPAETTDGRVVRVLVNAATAAEARAGLDAGAEGAGLIRTELAFLDAPDWPTREQHEAVLRPVLEALGDRTATVRVLDFGGDKAPPFLDRDERRRGIELLLAHPDALRDQLAAIASVGGTGLRVLLPLVRGAEDVEAARALLPGDGPRPALGAMVELPEAAEAAAELAAACDFLSVGTNDLTHATLGTDRFAGGPAPTGDPRVLRLIGATIEAAAAAGIPSEICGEAASDPDLLPILVGLGADELSVGAARVGEVRAAVRGLDAREAARDAATRSASPPGG